MSKEIRCPWCDEIVTPEPKVIQRKVDDVVERRCPQCGKLKLSHRICPFCGYYKKKACVTILTKEEKKKERDKKKTKK